MAKDALSRLYWHRLDPGATGAFLLGSSPNATCKLSERIADVGRGLAKSEGQLSSEREEQTPRSSLPHAGI